MGHQTFIPTFEAWVVLRVGIDCVSLKQEPKGLKSKTLDQ